MSYGTGPYGTGPYGLTVNATPGSVANVLVSSKYYDGRTGDYVFSDDGNPVAQDDTAHQVLLLSARYIKPPQLIGLNYESTMRNQIRKALAPLTKTSPPTIRIDSIEVSTSGNTSTHIINYTNLRSRSRYSVAV